MPPKKKSAAAKAKAKAAAALTPRATRTSVPDTVTTSRGKEYETTAALARPRRESTLLHSPVVVKKAAAKKPVVKKTATATSSNKRGRPAKATVDDEPPAKRGPGRPAKKVAEEVDDEEEDEDEDEAAVDEPVPAPKARGRPPNKITKLAPKKPAAAKAAPKAPAKRGRPSKAKAEEDAGESAVEEAPPQKRGRGRPPKKMQDAVPKEESGPPKKRGSSPRGGETTKIDGDDDAAAEQLEDELIDTAEEAASKPAARGRGRPKGTGKGKGAKAKAATHDEEEQQADGDDETEATSGKQYWLMKAEQEDREEILENGETFNAKFTVDDLKFKGGPEPWDGVRNAVAAKNMRAMKQGDLAFFYASGGKSGRKPGIVGIMEIVKEHELDQTAWDESSYGYVKDAKARDRWCVVHVEYRNKLTKPVLLSQLQKYSGDGGVLSKMQVLKQSRLSVTSVSEAEWNFIVERLIEGFEGEDALPGAEASLTNGTTNAEEESTLITTEQPGGEVIVNEASDKELDLDLPPGTVPAGPVLPTTESEVPSTDTIFPAGTSQTSRPASRAGSHAPSVKAKAASRQSSRASSVAGSLAPPATEVRGRSRTPKVRAGSAAPTNGISGDGLAGMQTIGEDDE